MVLVTTLLVTHSTRGMSYTDGAMVRVISTGMIDANPGYAPASCTILSRYAWTSPSRVPPMVIS